VERARARRRRTVAFATAAPPAAAARTLARELRDHHRPTAEHSNRLAGVARRVADRMGLDPLDATEVELVAVLHDVGKLAVDPGILDQRGPLDPGQRVAILRHTIEGAELLACTAGLEHLAGAVRATHERWDGTGYPDGLTGTAIPRAARIVTCVDAFDAMVSSDRPYRRALTRAEALVRLREGAGAQFDPAVVRAVPAVLGC
jgi:HD-GYP domain-containing protein (c-di-GMP phosphodiesterase class II)